MPSIQTKFFGELEYTPDSLFSFPQGLPGFEDEHDFAFLKMPGSEPLLFLQSLTTRHLCFVLLPILTLDPVYLLQMSPEDLAVLDLPAEKQPVIGQDILCAALICAAEQEAPTANLMAPIVVNLRNKQGMQVIQHASGYSHRHPMNSEETVLAC